MQLSNIAPCLWFDTQADPIEKSERAMTAMMKMDKLDIAALDKAYEGR